MGGFANQATAPLGIKMFSGGPYADGGAGDREQENLDKYMAQIGPVIQAISQGAGVVNPQTGQGGPPGGNPYALSSGQQTELNQEQSITTEEYNQILSKVKSNLSARGMGDSSTMAAAELYLKQQMATQMGGERVQAGQNAYQNRNQAMQQIAQLLSGGYQEQQKVTQTQGATAEKSHADAMHQLGSLLGLGLYAGGVGPFGASKAAPGGGAGGYDSGIQGQIEGEFGPGGGMAPIPSINWGAMKNSVHGG